MSLNIVGLRQQPRRAVPAEAAGSIGPTFLCFNPERAALQHVVPLEFLRSGEQGRICELDGGAGAVHRLEEMGLRAGAVIRMVQPGSPCIVAVNNHRISYRGDGTATVLVETLNEGVPL